MKKPPYIILYIILILMVYGNNANFWTYSSCHKDTPWTRGYGAPIRSWIKSMVPSFNKTDNPFGDNIGIHVTYEQQNGPRVTMIVRKENRYILRIKIHIHKY